MILLDTNVLSALMREAPDANVLRWLDRQPRLSVWTTSVTVLEIRVGLQILAAGRRRAVLMAAFERLLEAIGRRIAPFDESSADFAADLMAARKRSGHSGDLRDTMIAGIAISHNASLATRNTAHFRDTAVSLINPWTA